MHLDFNYNTYLQKLFPQRTNKQTNLQFSYREVLLRSQHVIITVILRWQHVTFYLKLFTSSDWELCFSLATLSTPGGTAVMSAQKIPTLQAVFKSSWTILIMTWHNAPYVHFKFALKIFKNIIKMFFFWLLTVFSIYGVVKKKKKAIYACSCPLKTTRTSKCKDRFILSVTD